MKDHKDLDVWKKSMDLVEDVYKETKKFSPDEQYGLRSQIRRSVVSIPSNIAEGAGRNSDKEFKQFLYIAMGSISELETQLLIAQRLKYLTNVNKLFNLIEDIKKMLHGLIGYIRKKQK